MENNNEKIYIGQTIRFLISQGVGRQKIMDKLRAGEEGFRVHELSDNNQTIILVEEKEIQKSEGD